MSSLPAKHDSFNDFVVNLWENSANHMLTRKGHINSALLEKVQRFKKYYLPFSLLLRLKMYCSSFSAFPDSMAGVCNDINHDV